MKLKEVYIDLEIEIGDYSNFFRCFIKHDLLDTQHIIAYGHRTKRGFESKITPDTLDYFTFKNNYFRNYKITDCNKQFVFLKILNFQYCNFRCGRLLMYFRAKLGFEINE